MIRRFITELQMRRRELKKEAFIRELVERYPYTRSQIDMAVAIHGIDNITHALDGAVWFGCDPGDQCLASAWQDLTR